MAGSIWRRQPTEHREVLDVAGEQSSVEGDCGSGDSQICRVDATAAGEPLPSEFDSDLGKRLVQGVPAEHAEQGRLLYRSEDMVEACQEIQAMGHEINLHNNAVTVGLRTGVDPYDVVAEELDYLRGRGLEHGHTRIGAARGVPARPRLPRRPRQGLPA
jgi:hypothetical protein